MEENKKKYFHIIIDGTSNCEMYSSRWTTFFYELVKKYRLKNHIIFHGQKFRKKLDHVFDLTDSTIGSLRRHCNGISNIKTLKNRKYTVRKIPFIYSELDSDFECMPYIMKAASDKSSIDIRQIFHFIK